MASLRESESSAPNKVRIRAIVARSACNRPKQNLNFHISTLNLSISIIEKVNIDGIEMFQRVFFSPSYCFYSIDNGHASYVRDAPPPTLSSGRERNCKSRERVQTTTKTRVLRAGRAAARAI